MLNHQRLQNIVSSLFKEYSLFQGQIFISKGGELIAFQKLLNDIYQHPSKHSHLGAVNHIFTTFGGCTPPTLKHEETFHSQFAQENQVLSCDYRKGDPKINSNHSVESPAF